MLFPVRLASAMASGVALVDRERSGFIPDGLVTAVAPARPKICNSLCMASQHWF